MKAVLLFTGYAVLCLLQFYSLTVNAAGGSANGSVGSKNAIAKVIKVTPQIDNDWIVAVKDPKSPTGYSVKVKEFLNEPFFNNYFVVSMYSRSTPNDKLQKFFAAHICDLLKPKDDNNYSKDNFLPRQIIDIILPGRYGNCNIANTTEPIKASGIVNTNPDTNKGVTFPKSSPFELVVNVLSMRQINNPDTKYFFQVVFSVGGNFQASGNVGGSTSGKKGRAGAGVKATFLAPLPESTFYK